MHNNFETAIDLTRDLEPYRTSTELWNAMAESAGIDEAQFIAMEKIISDAAPLVIITHDDADGWTSAAMITLLRQKLLGVDSTQLDQVLPLATGSQESQCKKVLEAAGIPPDAHIIILDLNQTNPQKALVLLGIGDRLVGRVDHHQVGGENLQANIVPTTPDKVYIDSTSLLVRAFFENMFSRENVPLDAETLSVFDNNALLGLVGDKKYEEGNRIAHAFENMPDGSLQRYNKIADVLNYMAIRPVDLNDPMYVQAKAQIQEYLHNLSVVDDAAVEKFADIEYVQHISKLIDQYTKEVMDVDAGVESDSADGIHKQASQHPDISVSIEEQHGFRGIKIVFDETNQTENIYDMVEPLWKSLYGGLKKVKDLDFVIFAVAEHPAKLPSATEPPRINYRVGVLKQRASFDEKDKVTVDGLHMNANTVAIITQNGGGHETRAGDNLAVGHVVSTDTDARTIGSAHDLVEYMFGRCIEQLTS